MVPDGSANAPVYYRYEYYHTDHQGNLRLTYSDLDADTKIDPLSEVLQMTNYYPFGMEHQGHGWTFIGPENLEKFQGQESHPDFDLNFSEFRWRSHQSDLGRFTSIDPLSEFYPHNSTYAFSENKLISGVELEGLEKIYFMNSYTMKLGGGAFTSLTQIDYGAGIVQRFSNVDPNKFEGDVNLGYDIFVVAEHMYDGKGGETTTMGSPSEKVLFPNEGNKKNQIGPRNEMVNKALELGEGRAYDFFKKVYTEEVFLSSEFKESLSQGRGQIIVAMNENHLESAYSINPAYNYMFKAIRSLGHEIGAHAINSSRNNNLDVLIEHFHWNGVAIMATPNPGVIGTSQGYLDIDVQEYLDKLEEFNSWDMQKAPVIRYSEIRF